MKAQQRYNVTEANRKRHPKAATAGALVPAVQLLWPAIGPITFRFKEPYDEPREWGKLHNGLDIGCPIGSPIRAAIKGEVFEIGFQAGGYGNFILLDHIKKQRTRYAHLSQANVTPGQTVYCGQIIGLSGQTGWTTGPHVHFEYIVNGLRLDPEPFLSLTCPIDDEPPAPEPAPTLPICMEISFSQMKVSVDALNVRAGPGLQHPVVGVLKRDDIIGATAIYAPDDTWVRHAWGWSALFWKNQQFMKPAIENVDY